MTERRHLIGALNWLPSYGRGTLMADGVAALVVTVMLIPQSLAYAMVAGLPPVVGLYASIAPLVLYALVGSGRTLSVGPVAVASLMSAAAAGQVAQGDPALFYEASVALAWMGGGFLLLLGVLRAGFVVNLLSHPVVSGFVAASAVLIAMGQLGHMVGIKASGDTLPVLLNSLWQGVEQLRWPTVVLATVTWGWLKWSKERGHIHLQALGVSPFSAALLSRASPVLAILVGVAVVKNFPQAGIATVGVISADLPTLRAPDFTPTLWMELVVPAALIALVGFVETVSVGHALAARRKQKINPDSELLGLGLANCGSAALGGFAVTAGFSRSVVNFEAGAQTPMAGVFTAVGMLLACLTLTPWLSDLPKATLAATIVVAVLGLLDFTIPVNLWKYSRRDFVAYSLTFALVLLAGVEVGILSGVVFSVLALLAAISRPHYALVGRVPGTEHFRNQLRHQVEQVPGVLSLRIDESLYFPNARWVEDLLLKLCVDHPQTQVLILQCSAINHIDASSLEALESADANLQHMGVTLMLSEVKGPVMDRLQTAHWFVSIAARIGFTHSGTVEMAKSLVRQAHQLSSIAKHDDQDV